MRKYSHLVTEEQVVMRVLSSSYRRASGDEKVLSSSYRRASGDENTRI